MINCHFRCGSGFTLIEIIVTVAIVGLALVPLLGFFSNQVVGVREIAAFSTAVNIAEAQLQNYIHIIYNLDATDSVYIVEEDVTSEVVGLFPDESGLLGENLKVVATVQKSSLAPEYGYEILIVLTWGVNGKYRLWTVIPIQEYVDMTNGTL